MQLNDFNETIMTERRALTSLMDDILLVTWQDLDRIDRHSGKTVLTHPKQLVVEALEEI